MQADDFLHVKPYREIDRRSAGLLRVAYAAIKDGGTRLSTEDLCFHEHVERRDVEKLAARSLMHIDGRGCRPTVLGLLYLSAEAFDVLQRLDQLIVRLHDAYRPRAKASFLPIAIELGATPDNLDLLIEFLRDLGVPVTSPPDVEVPLTEDWRRRTSLAAAITQHYPHVFQSQSPVIEESLPRTLPVRLTSLRVGGFRAVADVHIGFGHAATVVVGPNAVGKSTVLDALRFIAQVADLGLEHALLLNGGLPHLRTRGAALPVELEIGFELETRAGQWEPGTYSLVLHELYGQPIRDTERLALGSTSLQLLIDAERGSVRMTRADGSAVDLIHPVASSALSLVKNSAEFPVAYALRSALATTLLIEQDVTFSTRDKAAGGRLGTGRAAPDVAPIVFGFALASDQSANRLGQIVAELVPGVESISRVLDVGTPSLLIKERGVPGHARYADLSTGTRRMLQLAALYAQPEPPSIVLLEEPEAGLHPGAMTALADLLRSLGRRSTVIATTHSPQLVEVLDAKSEVVTLDRDGERLRAVSLAEAIRSSRWLSAFGSSGEAFLRRATERKT